MANGIKLRRGLKAALATTIADGEFVFCTDSGELGFKKGTVEKYVDLEKLSTDIDGLQDKVDNVIDNQGSLLPGQFKVSVNKFYDFDLNPQAKPSNYGGYRIPIAKVNPLFIGEEFALHQVFNFTNVIIQMHDFNEYGVFNLNNLSLNRLIFSIQSDGHNVFKIEGSNFADLSPVILEDGYGNFALWLEVVINSTETQKLSIKFTMTCLSESGEDINKQPYNVFLPPTDLPIHPYN